MLEMLELLELLGPRCRSTATPSSLSGVSVSGNAACTQPVATHTEMDLRAVALLMRYIVMSAQAEGAKQNDC